MASNAQSFGTNRVILDPDQLTDGLLQIFVKGEHEPRYRLYADGTVAVGDGVTPPMRTFASLQGVIDVLNDFAMRLSDIEDQALPFRVGELETQVAGLL